MKRIYLDYAATTPLLPEAREAMTQWLARGFGNPSSLHAHGREAKAAIDQAREQVSSALGCLFAEVVFTSGGTEAANLALVGAALGNQDPSRNRIVMSAVEHHCVLHTKPLLERLGYTVSLLPVERSGRLRLDALQETLDERVLLVSVMHANNELGTWQPVREVVSAAHAKGALVHCDAVQTFRVDEPFRGRWGVDDLGVDLLNVSAHKIGGPKGVGALFVRAGVKIKPLIAGGTQERELRAGTENVAAIAGFGSATAVDLEDGRPAAKAAFIGRLNPGNVMPTVPHNVACLYGILHLRAPGIDAETLLIRLDREGVSAGSGAACSSGSLEPSHVLAACGYSPQESKEGLRFSFGVGTSEAEAEAGAAILSSVIDKIAASRSA